MRKFVFALFVLFLFGSVSEGSIRVLGGINLSRYAGVIPSGDNWKQKSGPDVGIGFNFGLGSYVSVEIEALYRQAGSRLEHWFSGFHIYTLNYTLKEIYVPLLLKATFGNNFLHYFELGGALSYVLSHDVAVEGDVEILVLPPDTKRVYPMVIFGLGFELPVGQIAVFTEIRYQYALTNILTSEISSQKPQGIVLLLGIGF
ncbi:MAG: outer membrane beta-barrel protein [Candidatus Aminicenantes bacterium]|jgi:hypothetical protein